mmetsp:Transcript_8618/g.15633  ORF Transcript_8618/g.15633 Transcript_8618/m.15633 type:complete len:470 (-) Transcript_8618:2323-3732(-)|eukprot:CAMPEP_0198288248 /NCGR_PEP_ID=MMETSP1449-20131203/6818_1 /TAXON_ID=420275 /ORGANISM="Attheya septentrionalis, Strain CCMP2084" /LENGTH=469 /DNA_ID=CAMNT_0043986361 /DNA_START=65 /DNA_END=1474 /DNA_ORIENTATION=-
MTFETDDSVMLVEFTPKTTMWTKIQRRKKLWSLKREAASQICKLRESQIEDEESSRNGENPANLALRSKYFPSLSGNGLSVSISLHKTNFYTQMPSFKHFKDIMNDDLFKEAPADWHVIITDIVGSTQAIQAGAYADVNTIGAASISTVLHELGEEDFPFAFGGDGASLLIPQHCIGHVLEVLMRLQKLAKDNFDLELRVGHIPVKTLVDDGFKIEVAKHELCAGRCIAVFRGGGLSEAEARIKTNIEKYCVKGPDELGSIDLKNLKCRWNHIPSKRGKIMSLIVKASDTSVYSEVLEQLDRIYHGKLDEANPVNSELLTHKSLDQIYQDEARFHSTKTPSFYIRASEIFASVSIFNYKVDPIYFDAKHYANSQRSHADFQKFDDMLRMVIDCSDDQAGSIVALLKTEYDKGRLTYGTHISKRAIMTCYVEDESKDGGHIHFIDGDNGGYSVAAKQMKWQTSRANRVKH